MRAIQSLRSDDKGYYCTLIWQGDSDGHKDLSNINTLCTRYYQKKGVALRSVTQLRNKLGFKTAEIIDQTKEA